MEKISKINYTFNYDGRTPESFDDSYKGLIKVLENYSKKIPLEIEFSMRSTLSKDQKTKIDKALIEYKRKPAFNKNIEEKAA